MLPIWYDHRVLIAPLVAWLSAQVAKPLFVFVRTRRLAPGMLFSAGGMPSSHAALVTSLATAVGLVEGCGSSLFAVTVVLAGIVLYDAAGVRWAVSRHARVLNQMLDGHSSPKRRLPESIGHTPLQVVAGALLGIALSLMIVCL